MLLGTLVASLCSTYKSPEEANILAKPIELKSLHIYSSRKDIMWWFYDRYSEIVFNIVIKLFDNLSFVLELWFWHLENTLM